MMMAYLHKEGGIWNYADRGEIPSKCSPHLWHFKDTLYMNIYMGLLMMLTIITLNKWQQPCFRMTMTLKTWHMIIDEGGNMILCGPLDLDLDLDDIMRTWEMPSKCSPRLWQFQDILYGIVPHQSQKSIKTWRGEKYKQALEKMFWYKVIGEVLLQSIVDFWIKCSTSAAGGEDRWGNIPGTEE